MEKMRKEEEQAAEALPNDLLREILSRVPYRSLCRLKCVSPAWLALCSDPAVRRRSPQTLSGFFGDSPGATRFLNLSGRGPPLVDPSFLFLRLRGYQRVTLMSCCGGILLCHGMRAGRGEYVVCNPATEEIWAALPRPDSHEPSEPHAYGRTISLCFDPAVPSRFAVFVIIDDDHDITTIEVYSSDAGKWTSMTSGWGYQILTTSCESGYFFLGGTLHSIAYDSGDNTLDSEGNVIKFIVTMDTEGSTWRTIRQPPKSDFSFIGKSQGCIYGMEIDDSNGCRLSVWVLEDCVSGRWTLKHTASVLELLGRPCCEQCEYYSLVAIHPECNLIFLDGGVDPERTLMSYDMDTRKLHVICSVVPMETLQPHVPCFAEWPPSGAR